VQVLPFASEETLSQLEQNIGGAGSVTDMLHQGASPKNITERLLHGLGISDGGFSLQPRRASNPATSLSAHFEYIHAVRTMGIYTSAVSIGEPPALSASPSIKALLLARHYCAELPSIRISRKWVVALLKIWS